MPGKYSGIARVEEERARGCTRAIKCRLCEVVGGREKKKEAQSDRYGGPGGAGDGFTDSWGPAAAIALAGLSKL